MEAFSEAAYLAANPDVAEAVERGAFKSGRQHYDLYGKKEDRRFALLPLIFFVHVPKTAGSTVYSYLAEAEPAGRIHVETILGKETAFRNAASSAPWMSGHVPLLDAIRSVSAATDRKVRYFSLMRNPTDQIRSHYNWFYEMHARGPAFYDDVPSWAKEVSAAIRASADTPGAILENLRRYRDVFMNNQARHILDPNLSMPMGEGLRHYEMIATEQNISDLLTRMLGRQTIVKRSVNASLYHFTLAHFDDPQVQEYIASANTLDWQIYRQVSIAPATA